uniref:Uncharacterized protein n=1 Tax=Sus scrofa TaxID=9823 RepID=A0A4X1T2I1_PIG
QVNRLGIANLLCCTCFFNPISHAAPSRKAKGERQVNARATWTLASFPGISCEALKRLKKKKKKKEKEDKITNKKSHQARCAQPKP